MKNLTEADLVRIRTALEKDTIAEALKATQAVILNLFKAEVDKLIELTDSEVEVILEKGFNFNTKPKSLEHIQRIIQLYDTKKQLLDLMGE